jgi:hypothetical protein
VSRRDVFLATTVPLLRGTAVAADARPRLRGERAVEG